MNLTNPGLTYAILLFLSGGVSLLISIIAFQRRKALGGLPLSLLMISLTLWSIAYGIHWMFPMIKLAQFMSQFGVPLGIATAPTFFLLFSAELTHHSHWLSKKYVAFLAIEPAITMLIVCVAPLQSLYYGQVNLAEISNIQKGGPWFWFNSIYSYALILASLMLLIRFWSKQRGLIYRRQIELCILGMVILMVLNLLDIFKVFPFHDLDPTPFLFTLSGLFFAYSIFGMRMFDVIPVALDELIDQMIDGLIVVDSHSRIIEINQSAVDIIGGKRFQLIGQPLDVALFNVPELRHSVDRPGHSNRTIRLGDSTPQIMDVAINPLRSINGEAGNTLITWRDVTHLSKVEEELLRTNETLIEQIYEIESLQDSLRDQAIRDPLTNLYNRRYLDEIIPKEINRAERLGMQIVFLMVDVDYFKKINDSYGHEAGDITLQKIAFTLETNLRKGDVIARVGGEEFMVLLIDARIENAIHLAEKLRISIEELVIDYDKQPITVTVSVGVAAYPIHGDNTQEIMRAADLALYEAKTSGRNRACMG